LNALTPNLTFGLVPAQVLDIAWADVAPMLEKATNLMPNKFDVDSIKQSIESGVYTLWIVMDGTKAVAAIVTRVIEYPKRRALAMDWIGGGRMSEWLPLAQSTLERYARDNNCAHLEGYGREAWGRVLSKYNWRPEYVAYHMELDG
jgi:hypothetical protein